MNFRLPRNASVYSLQLLLCAALISATGCNRSANAPNAAAPSSGEITVSAAASLRDAFQEIGQMYEARTGRRISFNFGASGALQRQIEAAAPVDVFASAGAQQMNALADKNLIDRDTRRDFARNELVIVAPQNSPPPLNSFPDLDTAAVRRIAVGNPRTVPAGQYAAQVFNNLGLAAKLQPKLILAEDVRQVLDYVARGEVEAGVVYRTDAQVAGSSVRVVAVAPENSHEPILYPIAVVRESRNGQAAREFVELVTGAEGQAVLRRYGFGSAGER
jgi:molybdate transport system substrate-binding protein